MLVKDVLEHFLSRADWVDRNSTVDRVIVGNPDGEARTCLVTWMPGFSALREAVSRRVDLVICHEPTFWNHRDDNPSNEPMAREKLGFVEKHGLTVMRIHDCWDKWPEIGINWAWARFLGLGDEPAEIHANGYQQRYDIALVTLDHLARDVARKCSGIGEPMVQVSGQGDVLVSKIGIGAGCGCQIKPYLEMGCNCSIVCDDGMSYWREIQMAKDIDHPVIRVKHGTSEEPGMVTLTRYINAELPGIRAQHLPHGASFRLVGATQT